MTDFDINSLVRPCIQALEPYSCARNEFHGQASVWLDANESPYNAPFNRYPDPLQAQVKAKLAQVKGVEAGNIFLGNGSDECIDLVYRVFCEPKTDNVVAMSPSYGMYEVFAHIHDVAYRKVPLRPDFSLDVKALLGAVTPHTKAIFLCSPNNPTGNAIDTLLIERILDQAGCLVVVDEAYADFSSQPSMRHQLARHPNLIVLSTFSKAWASAGVRLGMAFASRAIVELFNKVKYPYNVNCLTQQYALEHLKKLDQLAGWRNAILAERGRLIDALARLPQVLKTYPTDANFVLVKTVDADGIYAHLCREGIVVRNRNRVEQCLGCLRITVGTPQENDAAINAISNYGNK